MQQEREESRARGREINVRRQINVGAVNSGWVVRHVGVVWRDMVCQATQTERSGAKGEGTSRDEDPFTYGSRTLLSGYPPPSYNDSQHGSPASSLFAKYKAIPHPNRMPFICTTPFPLLSPGVRFHALAVILTLTTLPATQSLPTLLLITLPGNVAFAQAPSPSHPPAALPFLSFALLNGTHSTTPRFFKGPNCLFGAGPPHMGRGFAATVAGWREYQV